MRRIEPRRADFWRSVSCGFRKTETGSVLPGATITITSAALLGGPATFVTNEKGQYRFPALAPGLYTLTIEISGFRTYIEEGLRVQVGATLERNVTLPLAALAESLTVTAESPLLDTKESGQSTHYGNEYLQNTPIRRMSMFDLLKSAPGMSAIALATSRSASPRSAREQNENTSLVDGTDFTGAYGGGVVPWVDTDVIEEIQIVGIGASAEYGNLQGAVFNVVSKQGGNDFQFDASYYGQFQEPDEPAGRARVRLPRRRDRIRAEPVPRLHDARRGPVLEDRLWFFGGYQYQRDHDSSPGADSRFPREFDTDRIFWKINWQITPTLKLMHSYHDDYWGGTGPVHRFLPIRFGRRVSWQQSFAHVREPHPHRVARIRSGTRASPATTGTERTYPIVVTRSRRVTTSRPASGAAARPPSSRERSAARSLTAS